MVSNDYDFAWPAAMNFAVLVSVFPGHLTRHLTTTLKDKKKKNDVHFMPFSSKQPIVRCPWRWCLHTVFQASQHSVFRSFETHGTCDGCFVHQSICWITSLDLSMSRTLDSQESEDGCWTLPCSGLDFLFHCSLLYNQNKTKEFCYSLWMNKMKFCHLGHSNSTQKGQFDNSV